MFNQNWHKVIERFLSEYIVKCLCPEVQNLLLASGRIQISRLLPVAQGVAKEKIDPWITVMDRRLILNDAMVYITGSFLF